jgi:hypothetical protein
MKTKLISQDTTAIPKVRSDLAPRAFVLSVLLIMIFVALISLVKYGRNVPLTEDWLLVAPLTGNEPNIINWLWAQNNEHRIPLPRLILLAVLKITNGDFRAGMFLNIVILGALAFAMTRAARYLRGGRTIFADAFFPVVLLHLGNWENLFWSWQVGFVLPTALTCAVLLVVVRYRAVVTASAAVLYGSCLIMLPLCGANGLLFVPLLSLWLGYCGVIHWHSAESNQRRRWIPRFLIGSAAIAICLTGLYFVDYVRPTWTPANPGLGTSLWTAVQFLALGFGPVARSSWKLSTVIGPGFVLLPTAVIAVLGVFHSKSVERHRSLGILVFLVSIAVFALAMGWGRAGVITIDRFWPIRYVLLAAPALCTAFFIWELYGPRRLRIVVQNALFLGMCLLIPFNTNHGFWWGDWYRKGMDAFERDLVAGVPQSILAERHRDFLFHSMESTKLSDLMRMLRDAGMGPFAQLRQNPAKPNNSMQIEMLMQAHPLLTQEIRYYMPEAREIILVWGVNGWAPMPEETRPEGTTIKNGVMQTPMKSTANIHVATVQVPSGATLDYGFLITKKAFCTEKTRAIWDGSEDYRMIVSQNGVLQIKRTLRIGNDGFPVRVIDSPLVIKEIRYRMPEAGAVFLVWGLNGWYAVPEGIRPKGTVLRKAVMHTPMVKAGDTYVAKLWVPTDATLNYGFLTTEKSGLFDMVRPAWDDAKDHRLINMQNEVIEVMPKVSLAEDFSNINFGIYLLLSIILIFLICIFKVYFSRKEE